MQNAPEEYTSLLTGRPSLHVKGVCASVQAQFQMCMASSIVQVSIVGVSFELNSKLYCCCVRHKELIGDLIRLHCVPIQFLEIILHHNTQLRVQTKVSMGVLPGTIKALPTPSHPLQNPFTPHTHTSSASMQALTQHILRSLHDPHRKASTSVHVPGGRQL